MAVLTCHSKHEWKDGADGRRFFVCEPYYVASYPNWDAATEDMTKREAAGFSVVASMDSGRVTVQYQMPSILTAAR